MFKIRHQLKRTPYNAIEDQEKWAEIGEYVEKMITEFAYHFDDVAIDDLEKSLTCTGLYALSKVQARYKYLWKEENGYED